MTSAAPPLLDAVVFHAPQTVEKAMKASLAWHDHPFRETHNLEDLGFDASTSCAKS